MTHIGVVGAGAGAAATAHRLADALPAADVTVLEKSRGVCGRAATRRRGPYTYDYGANYVREDERVAALLTTELDRDGLVDIEELVYTFDGDGDVAPGRGGEGAKWTYREGLTQLAKRLFAGTDATIQYETRVETLRRDDAAWTLIDADREAYGPFDAVVLNPPAPQSAALLADAAWDDPAREALRAAAAEVPYRTIWTAVLGYEDGIERPYYALVNTDDEHDLGWISREECKPGHVPDGESVLIAQAAPEWSRARYDADHAGNVADLADRAADVLDEPRLAEPDWWDHQGWRYALPDGRADLEAVRAAEEDGLYAVGDWVAGEARVGAALTCGLDAAERLASRY